MSAQTLWLREPHITEPDDPDRFHVRFGDTAVIADPEVSQLVDDFLQPGQMIAV